MKTNYFTEKVQNLTSKELIYIGKSKGEFSEKFILAALWELEVRKELTEELKGNLDIYELQLKEELSKTECENHFVPPDPPMQLKIAAYVLYPIFALELIGMFVLDRFSMIGFGSLALPSGLIAFIVAIFLHNGKVWARYALYVVFLFSTLFFFLRIQNVNLIEVLQQILLFAAIYFVTRRESRQWYEQKTAPSNNGI